MQTLIKEFYTVLTPKLGQTNLIEYKINLSDNKVIRLPPYKLSPPKMEVMRNQINKLLEQGVIEPSTSPYSSPAFLVPKGHDKHRLVVDYRQLNKRIEFESIPPVSYTHLFVGPSSSDDLTAHISALVLLLASGFNVSLPQTLSIYNFPSNHCYANPPPHSWFYYWPFSSWLTPFTVHWYTLFCDSVSGILSTCSPHWRRFSFM